MSPVVKRVIRFPLLLCKVTATKLRNPPQSGRHIIKSGIHQAGGPRRGDLQKGGSHGANGRGCAALCTAFGCAKGPSVPPGLRKGNSNISVLDSPPGGVQ